MVFCCDETLDRILVILSNSFREIHLYGTDILITLINPQTFSVLAPQISCICVHAGSQTKLHKETVGGTDAAEYFLYDSSSPNCEQTPWVLFR